ncbi:MAG: hypothetical protein LBH27_01965, partial [Endomicrobium sp.]|nr:hypothetical protein [Endomicrobium sp.]
MFKYLIKTLGCQMNICDSDDLNSVFLSHGACRVYNVFDADVFILNTCSVRSQSEQKAFSYIGLVEKLKRQNLNIKIVVIGCMSERLGNSIKKRFRNIDLIVGTSSIDDIASKIINLCCNKNYSKKINSDINYESKIVSNIVIMRGCSNYCSYCVVPFVRGVEKNLDYDTIVNKCFSAVKNGIKEITF